MYILSRIYCTKYSVEDYVYAGTFYDGTCTTPRKVYAKYTIYRTLWSNWNPFVIVYL